jgi:hypothetical protein
LLGDQSDHSPDWVYRQPEQDRNPQEPSAPAVELESDLIPGDFLAIDAKNNRRAAQEKQI